MTDIIIVGAGLAGVEAAYYAAESGAKVALYEMRPHKQTPAHKTANLRSLYAAILFAAQVLKTPWAC